MDKERIFLNIKELQEKIKALDERLSDPKEPVSALDLDTQLMYLRLMYDSYLSLRTEMLPEGKRKGKGRKEPQPKEQPKEQPAEPEQPEQLETSLPLLFAEEGARENAAAPVEAEAKKEAPLETVKVEIKEESQKDEIKVEVKEVVSEAPKEEPKEAPKKEIKETTETKEAPKEEPEAVMVETREVPEDGIDLNAIEFEDEPDEDDLYEEPYESKKEPEEPFIPYYPGLNPKAMDGEPETGFPHYSEKQVETLGDHFAHRIPSLNDQLSQKKGEDRSIGSRKQRDQINDLTKSIDLNLKFTFVRELFSGNAKLLSEELNNLNDCTRLESALSLFEEMKQKYRWKEETEAVQQLYELILRKFAR